MSGVAETMNGAGRYAGGVGPLVPGQQLRHVNGDAGGCKGTVIRIACGIVGPPVFLNVRVPRNQKKEKYF